MAGYGLPIFSSDQDAGTLRADFFVMRVILRDREDFAGTVGDPPVVLGDDEGAGQNKSADREMMSVMPFSRPRLQVLRLNFGVTVGHKICLEIVCVHWECSIAGLPMMPDRSMKMKPSDAAGVGRWVGT
jgi:hypothetical protein